MKKSLLSAAFMLLTMAALAQKNVVKFNVVGAALGSYTLVYERVLNTSSSLQLSLGYRTFTSTPNYKYTYSGPTAVLEYRYYVTTNSMDIPKGFYLAPFARFGTYSWKLIDDGHISGIPGYYNGKYTVTSIGGGVMAGYQFLIAKRLALDLFLGPQFKTKSTSPVTFDNPNVQDQYNSDPNSPKENTKSMAGGVGLRTGFNLGIAF